MKHYTKTLWEGKQWVVTDYGIERRCAEGGYPYDIDKESLASWSNSDHIPPQHMGSERWVDLDDFIIAWYVALSLHKIVIKDAKRVNKLVEKARKDRGISDKRRPIFDAVYKEWFPGRVNNSYHVYSLAELDAISQEVDRRVRAEIG